MESTRIDTFVHLGWKTEAGRRILSADAERIVHDAVRTASRDLGLVPVAVNSAWNHVHALIGWNTAIPFEYAVRTFKRRSRLRWNAESRRRPDLERLSWDSAYASCGVRREELADVERYVDFQKIHHDEGELWPRFERGLTPEERERPGTGRSEAGGGPRDLEIVEELENSGIRAPSTEEENPSRLLDPASADFAV